MRDRTVVRATGLDLVDRMLSLLLGAIAIAGAVFLLMPRTQRLAQVSGRSVEPFRSDVIGGWVARRRDKPDSPEQEFAHTLRTLAAELRSGSTPVDALQRAAASPVPWPRALSAARFGDSIEIGLLRDAQGNRRLGRYLRQLAACWHVGTTQGAGLAVTIERLALGVKSQLELEATLNSELAAPRATGRLLSLLPLVGIAMGYMLGADPLAWFVGSIGGAVTYLLAVVLTGVGALWSRRIVQRVESGFG